MLVGRDRQHVARHHAHRPPVAAAVARTTSSAWRRPRRCAAWPRRSTIVLKFHLTRSTAATRTTAARCPATPNCNVEGGGGAAQGAEQYGLLRRPEPPRCRREELERFVAARRTGRCATIQQMCTASHAGIWARCGDRPDRAIRDGQLLERHFQRLCGAMGACERIHRTPIPTAFTRHCSRFLMVWCAPRTPMSELDSFQGMQPISRWRWHQVQRDAVCALANRRHCDAAGGDVRGMGHVSRARVGPALPCMRPHLCRAGLAPRTLACRWRSRLTCCRSSSTARASPRRATGW